MTQLPKIEKCVCGGKAELVTWGDKKWVGCPKCGWNGSMVYKEASRLGICQWNMVMLAAKAAELAKRAVTLAGRDHEEGKNI